MSDPSSHFFEHNNIIVDPKQSPLRLDLFLTSRLAVVSRTRIQQGIRLGYIVVNNKRVKPREEFRPGLVHRLDKGTSGLLVVAKRNGNVIQSVTT